MLKLYAGNKDERCILVVDDHDQVRCLLKEWLETVFPGCKVIEAKTGEEAVVLAKAEAPGLVIMDFNLPSINGIEATKLITKDVPAAKVVMLTMYDDEVHRAEAFSAGVSDYVPKRLMQVSLLPSLSRLLMTTDGKEI